MITQLNVLHVSSARVFGGNEEHIRTLVKHLDRGRLNVAVAVPSDGEFASALEQNGIPTEHVEISVKRPWRSAKSLARLCRECGAQIIHSHNRHEDLVTALAGWLAGVPIRVTTIHDRINTNQQGERVRSLSCKVYNWILRHGFDAIIAVSKATRDDVIAEAGTDPDTTLHVVNGMDLERLDAVGDGMRKRVELRIRPSALVCGMVARVRGRDIDKKGHRYLFAAIPRVIERVPHAHFVVVGADETSADYLGDLAAGYGVTPYVDILGYRTDVLDIMLAFDIAVLPSLFEGLPRTLMEAMALGKPAVGSRVDGIAELVPHEQCGLLVPSQDSDALAEALVRLLSDTDLRRRMGQAARERIVTEFDGRAMARGTEAVYERLAEAKGIG